MEYREGTDGWIKRIGLIDTLYNNRFIHKSYYTKFNKSRDQRNASTLITFVVKHKLHKFSTELSMLYSMIKKFTYCF